jgi:hypothetical protein
MIGNQLSAPVDIDAAVDAAISAAQTAADDAQSAADAAQAAADDAQADADTANTALEKLAIAPQTITQAASLAYDVSSGRNAAVTLSQAAHTLAFGNVSAGQTGTLKVISANVLHTVTTYTVAGGAVRHPGGTPVALGVGSTILGWYYDGTDVHLFGLSLLSA